MSTTETPARNPRRRSSAAHETTAPSPAPVPAPPRIRRRGLAGIAVTIMAICGLGAAYLLSTVSDAQPVIAIASTINRGQVIERGDLTITEITPADGISPVPASQLDDIVGQRASVDLAQGGLLPADAFTTEVIPQEGQELVGLPLTPAQLPTESLRPGDTIRIVDTPRDQDEPPTRSPESSTATVVNVGAFDETGLVVVDVIVPAEEAPLLLARAATARIAVGLQSREN